MISSLFRREHRFLEPKWLNPHTSMMAAGDETHKTAAGGVTYANQCDTVPEWAFETNTDPVAPPFPASDSGRLRRWSEAASRTRDQPARSPRRSRDGGQHYGPRPVPGPRAHHAVIDMSSNPSCEREHKGPTRAQTVVVNQMAHFALRLSGSKTAWRRTLDDPRRIPSN